jgi:hypothetical protein
MLLVPALRADAPPDQPAAAAGNVSFHLEVCGWVRTDPPDLCSLLPQELFDFS